MEYIIIGVIVLGIICGFVSDYIAKGKGYDSKMYFLLGFFFSFIGIIVAAVQPDRNLMVNMAGKVNTASFYKDANKISLFIDKWYMDLPFEIEDAVIEISKVNEQSALKLILRNFGGKVIQSIYLDIKCYDDLGDAVSENNTIEYAYQDLKAVKGDLIGSDVLIPLPSIKTRKIDVLFNKMSFADGSVLRKEDIKDRENVPVPRSISELSDLERTAVLQLDQNLYKGAITCRYIPQHLDNNKWQCCCGKVNKNYMCEKCNRSKDGVFKIFSQTSIDGAVKEAKFKQKEKQENEVKKRSRIKKLLFALLGVIIIIVIYQVVTNIDVPGKIRISDNPKLRADIRTEFSENDIFVKEDFIIKYLQCAVDGFNRRSESNNGVIYLTPELKEQRRILVGAITRREQGKAEYEVFDELIFLDSKIDDASRFGSPLGEDEQKLMEDRIQGAVDYYLK